MAKALVDSVQELGWWSAPILIPNSGIQMDDNLLLKKWKNISPSKAHETEYFRDLPSPDWKGLQSRFENKWSIYLREHQDKGQGLEQFAREIVQQGELL